MAPIDAPVLIAGGGPVGMTLALALARHGVRSILVEANAETTRYPKMDLTNGRSMELFRRLGIVDRLRAVGVPEDHGFDVVWATSARGHLLHRFAYASSAEQRAATDARNDGTGTAEPPMRVSQVVIEPALKAAIDGHPLVDVRFGWAFEDLRQDADGVTATIRCTADGAARTVRSLYLAGCDGGASTVRRSIGIKVDGAHGVARLYMVHFRSRDHAVLGRFGRAGAPWHNQTPNGIVIAQDGADTWTLQTFLAPGADEAALDPHAALRAFAGGDLEHEVLLHNPWSAHLVVAERLVAGRVALAGDAAHQFIPTGGYGMNTGIGDAVALGWALAGLVQGWGGPGLLAAYEGERHATALRNRDVSEMHTAVRMRIAEHFASALAEGDLDAPEVEGRRAALGRAIADHGNLENECWGIEHGFSYEGSSIVCGEAGPAPAFDIGRCVPTTRPGARLPHVVLGDGSYLYDRLGTGFTLLVRGDAEPGAAAEAAAALGVPLAIARLRDEPVLDLCERRLVLVRPDDHVAWRGDVAPADWGAVLRRVTGHPT